MKKILAILLVCLTAIGQTAYAESKTDDEGKYIFDEQFAKEYTVSKMPAFTDEKTLSRELDLLVRLNILSGYEDGALGLDRTITRAQAAKMLCCTVEPDAMVKDIETQYTREGIEKLKKDYAYGGIDFVYDGFSDVDIDSWYHPYVYAAKNLMNCIGGYEDGTFRPENTVSEIEFLTMIERALGYSNMIEAEGGYPDGVIKLAKNLKLEDSPAAVPATRSRAATMLYNALHSNVVTIVGYALNENGFMEAKYETTQSLMGFRELCKVHGIVKKSPVMTDKTVIFVPDNDVTGARSINLDKGVEYTFIKAYEDIPEGEYDVYINYEHPETTAVICAD